MLAHLSSFLGFTVIVMLWNFPFCPKNLADPSYKHSGFCWYLWQQYCGGHMNVLTLSIPQNNRWIYDIHYKSCICKNKWTNRILILWISVCWCTWSGSGCLKLEKTVPRTLWQSQGVVSGLLPHPSAECSGTNLEQHRREVRAACWKQVGEFCPCSHSSCPRTVRPVTGFRPGILYPRVANLQSSCPENSKDKVNLMMFPSDALCAAADFN